MSARASISKPMYSVSKLCKKDLTINQLPIFASTSSKICWPRVRIVKTQAKAKRTKVYPQPREKVRQNKLAKRKSKTIRCKLTQKGHMKVNHLSNSNKLVKNQ